MAQAGAGRGVRHLNRRHARGGVPVDERFVRAMMEERLQMGIFSQLFGSGELWLNVAFLVCMFAVVIFRPQQVGNSGLYRMAYILFALSLIIPAVAQGIITLASLERRDFNRGAEISLTVIIPIVNVIGKILFGIAVICGLSSLRLRSRHDDD
jgi:hypothetical protein